MTSPAEAPPGPLLQFDPDPEAWLVGPTEDRPVEEWIPAATELMVEFFDLSPEQERERGLVEAILAATARAHPSELPYYVLRWRALGELPLPLFLGLVEREQGQDIAEDWLLAREQLVVERPLIDDLPADEGITIRRSLPYSTDEFHKVIVGARYVVDTGHPEVLVLAHTASDQASDVILAQDDIEAFLRTVRISSAPEEVA